VIGLVEENDGIAFQVMNTRIAGPQVAHRRLPAVLPIFTMGKIAEYQPDQKGIFSLERAGHSWQRVIAANLSDGYLGFP
jgi:hypothetical protein